MANILHFTARYRTRAEAREGARFVRAQPDRKIHGIRVKYAPNETLKPWLLEYEVEEVTIDQQNQA